MSANTNHEGRAREYNTLHNLRPFHAIRRNGVLYWKDEYNNVMAMREDNADYLRIFLYNQDAIEVVGEVVGPVKTLSVPG